MILAILVGFYSNPIMMSFTIFKRIPLDRNTLWTNVHWYPSVTHFLTLALKILRNKQHQLIQFSTITNNLYPFVLFDRLHELILSPKIYKRRKLAQTLNNSFAKDSRFIWWIKSQLPYRSNYWNKVSPYFILRTCLCKELIIIMSLFRFLLWNTQTNEHYLDWHITK